MEIHSVLERDVKQNTESRNLCVNILSCLELEVLIIPQKQASKLGKTGGRNMNP